MFFAILFLFVCFCHVMFSFFSTKPRDWFRRTSPKWPILCWVGRETVTSVTESLVPGTVCLFMPLWHPRYYVWRPVFIHFPYHELCTVTVQSLVISTTSLIFFIHSFTILPLLVICLVLTVILCEQLRSQAASISVVCPPTRIVFLSDFVKLGHNLCLCITVMPNLVRIFFDIISR